MNLTFVELFSGIGGFRLGLERSGWKCVWANDNNKYVNKIYAIHYGYGELYCEDIRKVRTERIPEHILLTAGFPCQAFSYAGKRGGFKDKRGTLFYEVCRIVKAKRPKLLLFENVRGILSNDKGRTFTKLLLSLDELGYDVEWWLLNSKNFRLPHRRERVFIIGHLRGFEPNTKKIFLNRRKHQMVEKENEIIQYPLAVELAYRKANMKRGRFSSICHSLDTSSSKGIIYKDGRVRKITPLECERLQGFPDGWTKWLSDTQRYKALGNAVTVNVIEHLGKLLKECLE